jgi:hypothetical protein
MKALRIFCSAFALLLLSVFAGGGPAPAKPRRDLDDGRVSGERAGFQNVDMGASSTLKAAVRSATVVTERERIQLQAFLRALAISQMAGYRIAATPPVSSVVANGVDDNLGTGNGPQR